MKPTGRRSSRSRPKDVADFDLNIADWRVQVDSTERQRIVKNISESLKRNLPISGPEGLNELRKIAVRFEEKIYTAATSQADYLKKISLKMLSMESKSRQAPAGNATVTDISHVYQIPLHPDNGMEGMNGSTSRSEGVAAINANDSDWRAQLEPADRQRVIDKISETIKRNQPISGPEGLNECRKIAVRFEEKIYTAATSQADYLKKISLKMLSMESKSRQAPAGNATVTDISHVYQIPLHPDNGMEGMNGSTSRLEGVAAINANDTEWRAQLEPADRQRVINKILETLNRHLLVSGPDELHKIAVRFEEKIYAASTSQADYLNKISLKMLSLGVKK